ncbi:CoA transferase (plasmid) [Nocardioides sp. R1-1]|uniref:CaiB/BaiF CoA-transferase family protein n=1 Tax=Nocardioides sp. R1-1 TaxID=3383502 RepID=UPI0038CFD871
MVSKSDRLPLAGVRVVEMTDGLLDMTGRLLADLGAEVTKVEVVDASDNRSTAASQDGRRPLRFLVENFNKSSVALDPSSTAGLAQLWTLLESTDILIQASHRADEQVLDSEAVHARFPHLVVLSISDFGATGPYRGFVATDLVQLAMGSQLSRSGVWPREPCPMPFDLAHQSSAAQAAWAALVAYYGGLESGHGDCIDFSVFEATIEVVDPPFGTTGTATAGTMRSQEPVDPATTEWTRPKSRPYPIYPCADGYVRCLVLAPGQWQAMFSWLGEPEEFREPRFQTIIGRDQEKEALGRAYVELFRGRTKSELAAEGQTRGIPIAPVLNLAEVVEQEHFRQRGAFVDAELAPGVAAVIPSGFVEIDGERIGFRHRAPLLGEHNDALASVAGGEDFPPEVKRPGHQCAAPRVLPLSGLRVIDFGSIVFGAEVGRLFADLGADVIKVENSAFPDKYRGGAEAGSLIAKNFALGNRGRRSFGVDTRTVEGRGLVERLVKSADVVVSNFKPGTLERLGLGYAELSTVNPRIIWMSSSGFGDSGQWASWLAYGPAVRSAAGLTSIWHYPDDPGEFGDTTTVYPDHAAARVAGLAILSALIRRRVDGTGAKIQVSQAEVVLNHLSEQFGRESLGIFETERDGVPWGVYPCSGDDEWCVICVRDDGDWARFCEALGNPSWAEDPRFADQDARSVNRKVVDAAVRAWTEQHTPAFVTELLQEHGVPAGSMNRPIQLLADPHLAARDYLAAQAQPGFDEPLTTVRRPFLARHIQSAAISPSPEMAQDTETICSEVLGIQTSEAQRLVDDGVLQLSKSSAPAAGVSAS